MANKYHDELGRFCKADEMRAGVDRLIAKGDHTAAFTLYSEYKAIEDEKRGGLLTRLAGMRPLNGYGSSSKWNDVLAERRGYKSYLQAYLSPDEYGKHTPDVSHLASMFVVHADSYKALAQRREASGADVSQDKAVYRSMMRETLHLYETLTEFGRNSKAPSDSKVEGHLMARKAEVEAQGSDQGRIDSTALDKMLDIFGNSSNDQDWETYPERATTALKS